MTDGSAETEIGRDEIQTERDRDIGLVGGPPRTSAIVAKEKYPYRMGGNTPTGMIRRVTYARYHRWGR